MCLVSDIEVDVPTHGRMVSLELVGRFSVGMGQRFSSMRFPTKSCSKFSGQINL